MVAQTSNYNIDFTEDTCTSGLNRLRVSTWTQMMNRDSMMMVINRTTPSLGFESDTLYFESNYYLFRIDTLEVGWNNYSVYIYDTFYNLLIDSAHYEINLISQTCSKVLIRTFFDLDSNCSFDSYLENVRFPQMAIYKNGILESIEYSTSIYNNGIRFNGYDYLPTDVHKVEPVIHNTSCLSGGYFEFTFDTVSSEYLKDFALSCTDSFDLGISVSHSLRAAPGSSYIQATAHNNSCIVKNSTMHITMPTGFILDNIVPSYTSYSISGSTVSIDVDTLGSNMQRMYMLHIRAIDTALLPGSSVTYSASIDSLSIDVHPSDNEVNVIANLLGPYDPNQKIAVPERYLSTAEEEINYYIEFENVGNDTAFNVRIVDTISDLLDYNSFNITGSSHLFKFHRNNTHNVSILTFEFPDIKLADSTKPEANKGWISYTIKPKNGLNYGDEIKNTAHIYFDYNPAIVTNTTIHELKPLSINKFNKQSAFKVYPNPVENKLVIESKDNSLRKVVVRNIMGQIVHNQNVNNGTTTLNIESLNWINGIYLVECENESGEQQIFKVIKQ